MLNVRRPQRGLSILSASAERDGPAAGGDFARRSGLAFPARNGAGACEPCPMVMPRAQVSILAVLFDVRKAGIIAVLVMLTRMLRATVVAAALACAAVPLARAQQPTGGAVPPGAAELGQAVRA